MSDKPLGRAAPIRVYTDGIFGVRETEYDVLGYRVVVRSTGGIQRKETAHMAMQAHLAELEKRHQALEAEITEAMAHPSADDLRIAELKRKKLHVKDEIERLRLETVLH